MIFSETFSPNPLAATVKIAVKMTQKAFVDSLAERFDIQYESQTPALVEFDLGPKRSDNKEGGWPYKQAVDSLL